MKMENLEKQKTGNLEFLFLEKFLFALSKLFLFLLCFNYIFEFGTYVSVFFFNQNIRVYMTYE